MTEFYLHVAADTYREYRYSVRLGALGGLVPKAWRWKRNDGTTGATALDTSPERAEAACRRPDLPFIAHPVVREVFAD